jgi:hypothetical protein
MRVSVRPLIMLQAATIATLETLEEWSTTTDIWLTCEIQESFYTRFALFCALWSQPTSSGIDIDLSCFRNLAQYGLSTHQEVCSAESVTWHQGTLPCLSPCTFVPEVETKNMICAIQEGVVLPSAIPGSFHYGGDFGTKFTT